MEDTKSSHVPDHGDHGPTTALERKHLPLAQGSWSARKALCVAVGQVQSDRHRFRFHGVVESNYAFHLMVDLTRVSGDGQRAVLVKAPFGFTKKIGSATGSLPSSTACLARFGWCTTSP